MYMFKAHFILDLIIRLKHFIISIKILRIGKYKKIGNEE